MTQAVHDLGKFVTTSFGSSPVDAGNFTSSQTGTFVVVCLEYDTGSGAVTDITIGGVSVGANLVVNTGSPSQLKPGIGWIKNLPAGTYDVVVYFGTGVGFSPNCTVACYNLEGYGDPPGAGNKAVAGSGGSSQAISVDIPANGVAIFGCVLNQYVTGFTFSAATTDEIAGNTVNGHLTSVSAAAGHSETISWDGTNAAIFEIAVAFGPSSTGYVFDLGTGVFTLTGRPLNAPKTYNFVLGTGAFALTGHGLLQHSIFPLDPGTFTVGGNPTLRLYHKFYLHPAADDTRLLSALEKARVNAPSLEASREP